MSRFQKIILALFIITIACKNPLNSTKQDKSLASVFNNTLYLSNLEEMFPDNASHQDSVMVINAYTNRWVREQLIMHEAERNIPKDLDIDDLVQKYRASLILNSYEEQLTKNSLDTVIGDAELKAFYERTKDQYQLSTPIARCYFLKVPKPVPQPDSLQKWWNNPKSSDNLAKMQKYAQQYSKSFLLEDSTWHRVEDIAVLLPKGTVSGENISEGKEITINDAHFQYYFRALKTMNQKDIAPLSFIKEQASKFILNQRKQQLLETKKQEMYDSELKKNNVKILPF